MTAQRREIRFLDTAAVNRIAAGEVIERPAAAVKELVENSIDAGADRIDVYIADGGKTLLRVIDNGHGIPAGELPAAVSRHATSKIDGSDLTNINTFGFRGEALASLGAVGRLSVTSRVPGGPPAARILVNRGEVSEAEPAAMNEGTDIELRSIFYGTPARLKFLKSSRSETLAVIDAVKRLAMASPGISFTARDTSGGGEGRVAFKAAAESGDRLDALAARLARIMPEGFRENSAPIDAERDGFSITGHIGLPTFSRGSSIHQYFFVNSRPVKDKQLYGALRGAYSDLVPRDRHPVVALFIDCAPELVDVNVHPAKTEVRFRDQAAVRGALVSAIRRELGAGAGQRTSGGLSGDALEAMRGEGRKPARVYQMDHASREPGLRAPAPPRPEAGFAGMEPSARGDADDDFELIEEDSYPLGAARAQVHENYIVAQTDDGIVIVDQHAAHERLVYERMKRGMESSGVEAQMLLIPEIVNLPGEDCEALLEAAEGLRRLGLSVEPFGPGSVCVRETPAILGEVSGKALLADVLDEIKEHGSSRLLRERLDAVLSKMACHGSIRSGRRMRPDEMNALLREMESTPNSGQCNHGRPTYIELKLNDIERLFERR